MIATGRPAGKYVAELLQNNWPSDGLESTFRTTSAHYTQQQQAATRVADTLFQQANTVQGSSASYWIDASVASKRALASSIDSNIGGWFAALASQHSSIAFAVEQARGTIEALALKGNAFLELLDKNREIAVAAGDAELVNAIDVNKAACTRAFQEAIQTAAETAAAEITSLPSAPPPDVASPVAGGGSGPTTIAPPQWVAAEGSGPSIVQTGYPKEGGGGLGVVQKPAPEGDGQSGSASDSATEDGSPDLGVVQKPADGKEVPGQENKPGDPSTTGPDLGVVPSSPSQPSSSTPTTQSPSLPAGTPISSAGSGLGAPSGSAPSAASLGSPASLGAGSGKIPGAGLGTPSGTPAAASLGGAGQVPSTGGAGSGSGSGSNSGLGGLGRGFTPPVIPPAAVTQPQQQPTSGGVSGAAPASSAPAAQTGSSVQPSAPAAAPAPAAPTGGGAMPMMTSPASPAAGGPLAPAGSAAPSATPIHQSPSGPGAATPASAAPGSPAAGGPGGVVSAGAGAAAGYYGAGPADPSSADLEVARAVLSALLISTASYYTEFAVGVFTHAVAGRHVVVMTTSGRSYLPPTARVLPGVSIARTDPLAGDGWDGRFTNHSRPVDGLVAYAAATRDRLTWTAVATSEENDTKPPGIAFSRMSRPVGQSQPAAVPQGLHRLDATWPELARRARDVAAAERVAAGARIVDQIIRSVPQSALDEADTEMVSAIARGITAVPADQWEDYERRQLISVMAASLAGKSIGASSSAADAALSGEAETTLQHMLIQEAVLYLRHAPAHVSLEDLVYIAMHLGIDPLESMTLQ